MSVAINRLLNDFQQCLAELSVVSGGSYQPPVGVVDTMREAAGRVDGLDSSQLVAQSSAASGARRDKGDGFSYVLDILTSGSGMQLAGGGLEERLRDFQSDHEEDEVASKKFTDDAQSCGTAVDDIRDSSEIGLSEILGSVIPIIQLVTRLLRLHPIMRITGMVGTLASMVIEPAVSAFMRMIGDRDDAICGCYEEFLRRCEQLCEKELVEPPKQASEASSPAIGGKQNTAESTSVVEKPGNVPPISTASCEPGTPSHPVGQAEGKTATEQKPGPTGASGSAAEYCETSGASQKVTGEHLRTECVPNTPEPQPTPLPEPEQLDPAVSPTHTASSVQLGCEVAKSCVGELARVGLGMAVMGAQLVQEMATECLEQLRCEAVPSQPETQGIEPDRPSAQKPQTVQAAEPCAPSKPGETETAPEPEPECPPEPECAPAPEPEPECPPEEKPEPQLEPEPKPDPEPKDEVIEKPMPEHSVDKKQFHSGPAQVAPETQSKPEPAPEPVQPAQPATPAPQPEPETPAEPEHSAAHEPGDGEKEAEKAGGNTHRMGQW
ncbi:hypothetical protein [Corynebacterium pseudodiphtheriticum]|uniref:hypothetical protein n=1 Tax=Corynebacterium pseudodiphtheriticum TaxID=37637 RepID=UPI002543EC94|nr:hypothetical protein [Corynebacterium pseudodiphtheriticum]MDK4240746.1 hypothetical protein [Corynebacterium pseudodiphtheriticum]